LSRRDDNRLLFDLNRLKGLNWLPSCKAAYEGFEAGQAAEKHVNAVGGPVFYPTSWSEKDEKIFLFLVAPTARSRDQKYRPLTK